MSTIQLGHPVHDALEPNPAEGRGITPAYLTELADFVLGQSRWGRPMGLLPSPLRRTQALPCVAGDQLQLSAICAIGTNGHALIATPEGPGPRIKALDLKSLPPGDHVVHVCLAPRREPCGEPLLLRAGAAPARVPRHRVARLVLAPEPQHREYLDWLPVARVMRERRGGFVASVIDADYHPPIADLAAYLLEPHPLVTLAERGLQVRDTVSDAALAALLRVELQALRGIARHGRPELGMLQAQRCLGLLAQARPAGLILPGGLEQRDYDPLTFCDFLAELAAALRSEHSHEDLPELLVIDGERYMKVEGQFEPNGAGLWLWSAPRENFALSAIALYFPRALASELPQLRFSRQKDGVEGFGAPVVAKQVNGSGVALHLEGLRSTVDHVYLTVMNNLQAIHLVQRLNDGHALYYR